MPIIETLTVYVGGAVGKALVKSWIGSSDLLADTGSDTGALLAKAGIGVLERRRLKRELEEATERVAERLAQFFDAEEFGGLPAHEAEAAALAVARTVDEGFTDPAIALEADLDARRLEDELRRACPTAPADALLAPLAVRLYDIALQETCAYLVTMTENLPRFQGQAFAELLSRSRSLAERLEEAVENLPTTSVAEALEFETRYRREVARRFDQLQLFGLSTETEVSRYRLSVAYLTLTAAVSSHPGDPHTRADGPFEEATTDVAKSGRDRGVGRQTADTDHGADLDHDADPDVDVDVDAEDEVVRVDNLMASSRRVLIRGDAGSGKTTLLQWLAVNAARRTFPPALAALNDLTPFVIQLRRYADAALPTPEQFTGAANVTLGDLAPPNWAVDRLRTGRAMVLVDGVDELPANRREEVRLWLDDILAAFPDCALTVTSRPPAVDEEWLSDADFTHCVLEPMGLKDVDEFIDHWHAAVGVTASASEVEQLVAHQRQLKLAIRQNAPLRRLATSPLLCAMLCALNRRDEARLPHERIELYRIALDALLQNRDAARNVLRPDLPSLSLSRKIIVLQELAYWLVRNGYTDAPRERAITQIAKTLERTEPSADSAAVFEGLLQRTGLLREPIQGRVDFIHRTFLEYLAARAVVDVGDIGMLVEHADDDAWSEIVVLAAGVANREQRHELVKRLLDIGDEGAGHRHHLLAVACLENAPELDPALATRVEQALAARIPPQTIWEGKALATAGALAVPLLGRVPGMRAVEARAAIRVLGLVGTDEAMDQIATYGSDGRLTVIRELMRQWQRFDETDYAQRVMANSPLDDRPLIVGRNLPLSVVTHLQRLRRLEVDKDATDADIRDIAATSLRSLDLERAGTLRTVADVGSTTTLEHFQVAEAPALPSLTRVGEFERLRSLWLYYCPSILELLPAGETWPESLQSLLVNGADQLDLATLVDSNIEDLDVTADRLVGFESLSELERLSELVVEHCNSPYRSTPSVQMAH